MQVIDAMVLLGVTCLFTFEVLSITKVSAEDIHDMCPSSFLWEWMMVSLVLNHFQLTFSLIHFTIGTNYHAFARRAVFMSGIKILAMQAWAAVELWGRECSSAIASTLLYRLTLAVFIVSCIAFPVSMYIVLRTDTPTRSNVMRV